MLPRMNVSQIRVGIVQIPGILCMIWLAVAKVACFMQEHVACRGDAEKVCPYSQPIWPDSGD